MPYWATVGIVFARFGAEPLSKAELETLSTTSAVVIDKYGGIPYLEEFLLLGAVASVFGPRCLSIYFRYKAGKAELEAREAAKKSEAEKNPPAQVAAPQPAAQAA